MTAAAAIVALAGAAWAQPKPATPNTPAAQPGAATPAQPDQPAIGTTDPDMVTLAAFSDPVQLATLVDLVAKTLSINITIQGDLPGTVVFNAPVPVRKSDLINLLDTLLEQQGFTITQDRFGFYVVHPIGNVTVNLRSEIPTTRVFSTPNMRPSALKTAIEAQTGPPQPGAQGARQYAYMDELGVIVVTDTPRRVAAVESLVARFLEEFAKATYTRLELNHVSAPVARERALQLVGVAVQGTSRAAVPGQEGVAPGTRPGTLDNIGDRLTIDAQGNALIFRGLPEEAEQVRSVLTVIDVQNTLIPRRYFAGSSAPQIADLARLMGLGEIISIGARDSFNMNANFDFNTVERARQQQQGSSGFAGGPFMVVDQSTGNIVYYGTGSQQSQLDALIGELDTGSERITIEVYKLSHSDAEQVAEVMLGLIQNTTPVGTAELLPDGTPAPTPFRPVRNLQQPELLGMPGEGEGLSLEGTGFVIADKDNNQVLVKAPAGQQPEFAKLIEKLDLRRPQVYIEAKIVAVTWSDEMRLAFETQFTNINGSGFGFMTDFGLGTTSNLNAAKDVATDLGGLTAALIKSEQVPIIINALQNKADTRILSSPQLLVDDNEDAELVSVDEEPTQTTTQQAGNEQTTGFGGYEEAGTTLKVTPQISEGGYLRLKYEAKLSAFTSEATATLPPSRQVNTISANSVTVPSGATVVVGGLNFKTNGKTVAQIPFLGDIPLVGALFQDQNTRDRTTTLYIFMTPRILRDPTFYDLMLLSRGPQAASQIDSGIPTLEPTMIEIQSTDMIVEAPSAPNSR